MLAADAEYRYALTPHARAFIEAIYEPTRAAELYQAACDAFDIARHAQPEKSSSRARVRGHRSGRAECSDPVVTRALKYPVTK